MNFKKWPRTDVGTVLLHWAVVGAIVVLALSGLRYISDDGDVAMVREIDAYLPANSVWLIHIGAGYVLTLIMVAYALYISKARLGDRIKLNAARIQGLFGTAKARWSVINIMMIWSFFIAAIGACITGWLAYYGMAGSVLWLHQQCAWAILSFPVLHVLAQLRLGGVPHLIRVVRPKQAEAAAEEIDLANVVADLLAERRAAQRITLPTSSQSR